MKYQELRLANQSLQDAYDRLLTQKEKMVQNEKMASIGMLTTGIAQEINSPLGFIRSNLEILQDYLERINEGLRAYMTTCDKLQATSPTADQLKLMHSLHEKHQELEMDFIASDSQASLEEALVGIQRVEGIIKNLRDFSNTDSDYRTLTDINSCLDNTLNLIWNQIRYVCNVKKQYGQLPGIFANGGQLSQVFVNVIMNAVQAFDKEDNILEIHTRFENDTVVIDFIDNGPGIPQEILGKIFDPFFSTRELLGGSGLGLYISHGVIRKHHGDITVTSTAGAGARFTIMLPTDIRGGER
ncbi:MAG: hypothetical protein RLZZ385_994 [Pseudomonadota bacterium]